MSVNHNGHNGKIGAALELLNDAAKTKKDELLKQVTNRYSDFKEAIESTREQAEEVIQEGQLRVKKAAKEVDKKIHKNPWVFIGASAAAALLAGFMFGRKSKKG